MSLELKPVSKQGARPVKCPVKRTVNLARRESRAGSALTLALGALAIAALCFCVTKFGVLDQLERQRQAEAAYQSVHAQLVMLQNALADYPEVQKEYRTYSRKWLYEDTTGSFVRVERVDALELLEDYLAPYGEVRAVRMKEDTMTVSMSGMSLEEISSMLTRLQARPLVAAASLNLAEARQSAQTEKLDFTLTVTLQNVQKEAAE